jgi:cytosine/adenosine deaminase-related metal-dependent hydrolase
LPSNFAADWVLPIAGAALRGGCVTVDGGLVVAVTTRPPADATSLGRCALLPALVNAHTHLELSYLRGRIPRAACFTDWVRPLLAARREAPNAETVTTAAGSAITEAWSSGTGLFGDVSNTLGAVQALRR